MAKEAKATNTMNAIKDLRPYQTGCLEHIETHPIFPREAGQPSLRPF